MAWVGPNKVLFEHHDSEACLLETVDQQVNWYAQDAHRALVPKYRAKSVLDRPSLEALANTLQMLGAMHQMRIANITIELESDSVTAAHLATVDRLVADASQDERVDHDVVNVDDDDEMGGSAGPSQQLADMTHVQAVVHHQANLPTLVHIDLTDMDTGDAGASAGQAADQSD